MTSLTELERSLAPDLRRAFDEVMPRLEEPVGATPHAVAERGGGDVVVLVPAGARRDRRRLHWLAGSAAAVALVVGATWWATGSRTPSAPAVSTATVTLNPTTTPTSTSTSPPNGSVVLPLDSLDPLTAARRVSINAVIDPTPEEEADLTIAGAILEDECVAAGGGEVRTLTSADHEVARDLAVERLRSTVQFLTSDGLESIRANGYGAPGPTDPTWRDTVEGSLEGQLLIAGCGGADDALRAGPGETELELLTEYPAEWGYERTRTDRDPEYAARYATYRDCMEDAGLRALEPGADADENSFFSSFLGSEPPSAEELRYAAVDIDCRLAVGLQEAYVDAITPIVEQFVVEEADALAAVRAEREVALAAAREVLRSHGIDPFTDDPAD